MISRINFLLGAASLSVLVFFFIGRFLILEGLAAVAPSLTPYFTAAYILSALMLTVLILAKTVIRLNPATSVARYQKAGVLTGFAQVLLLSGHAFVLFSVWSTFVPDNAAPVLWPWLFATLLYATGVAATILDWRQRASIAA